MIPEEGRKYSTARRVGLGDVSARGTARFDAVARWLQDVAAEDVEAAGLEEKVVWYVRSSRLDVEVLPLLRERVELTTFCSGLGPRWAERTTVAMGDRGASLRAVSVWVSLDPETGKPIRPSAAFREIYEGALATRPVAARLNHRAPSQDATASPWRIRWCDIDVLDHVNNAVYWAALEEELAKRAPSWRPSWAEIEFRAQLRFGDEVDVRSSSAEGLVEMWMCRGGQVCASGRAGRS